jgi:hypothetical protein
MCLCCACGVCSTCSFYHRPETNAILLAGSKFTESSFSPFLNGDHLGVYFVLYHWEAAHEAEDPLLHAAVKGNLQEK